MTGNGSWRFSLAQAFRRFPMNVCAVDVCLIDWQIRVKRSRAKRSRALQSCTWTGDVAAEESGNRDRWQRFWL